MTKLQDKEPESSAHKKTASSSHVRAKEYRKPMAVTAVRKYLDCPSLFTYPLCPRCASPMEREYQQYCDRCGQALDWKHFSRAKVVKVRCHKAVDQ